MCDYPKTRPILFSEEFAFLLYKRFARVAKSAVKPDYGLLKYNVRNSLEGYDDHIVISVDDKFEYGSHYSNRSSSSWWQNGSGKRWPNIEHILSYSAYFTWLNPNQILCCILKCEFEKALMALNTEGEYLNNIYINYDKHADLLQKALDQFVKTFTVPRKLNKVYIDINKYATFRFSKDTLKRLIESYSFYSSIWEEEADKCIHELNNAKKELDVWAERFTQKLFSVQSLKSKTENLYYKQWKFSKKNEKQGIEFSTLCLKIEILEELPGIQRETLNNRIYTAVKKFILKTKFEDEKYKNEFYSGISTFDFGGGNTIDDPIKYEEDIRTCYRDIAIFCRCNENTSISQDVLNELKNLYNEAVEIKKDKNAVLSGTIQLPYLELVLKKIKGIYKKNNLPLSSYNSIQSNNEPCCVSLYKAKQRIKYFREEIRRLTDEFEVWYDNVKTAKIELEQARLELKETNKKIDQKEKEWKELCEKLKRKDLL